MTIHQAYRDLLEELHVETVQSATQHTLKVQEMPPALYFPPPPKNKERKSKARHYLVGMAIGVAIAGSALTLTHHFNLTIPSSRQATVQVPHVTTSSLGKTEDSNALRSDVDLMKQILSGLVQSVQSLSQQAAAKGQVTEGDVITTFPYPIQVITDKANLRSGPNRSEKTLAIVPKDTILLAMSEQDGWMRVSTPKGEIGWVNRELVAEHAD